MANRIKGITEKIGGDTTKLQSALKGVNGEIKGAFAALNNHACKPDLPDYCRNYCLGGSIYLSLEYQ